MEFEELFDPQCLSELPNKPVISNQLLAYLNMLHEQALKVKHKSKDNLPDYYNPNTRIPVRVFAKPDLSGSVGVSVSIGSGVVTEITPPRYYQQELRRELEEITQGEVLFVSTTRHHLFGDNPDLFYSPVCLNVQNIKYFSRLAQVLLIDSDTIDPRTLKRHY